MSEQSSETTDSVSLAEPRYQLDLANVVPETTKKKCNTCSAKGSPTLHQWIKVVPVPVGTIEPEEALELLSLAKRVVMCQNCGTISVTK